MRGLWTVAVILVTGSSCLANQSTFDCKMRQLAMDYAYTIQPWLSDIKYKEIADALNGAEEAMNCNVSVKFRPHPVKSPSFTTPDAATATYYVDATTGSDINSGSIDAPFLTIQKAVMTARSSGPGAVILLRAGTFYLKEAIMLNEHDQGLTIQNYPEEEVTISGGKVIKPNWQVANLRNSMNIYRADLSSQGVDSMTGFRVNGKRMIRARYPNANPETDGFASSLIAKKWFKQTIPATPDKEEYPYRPFRDSSNMFQRFLLGISGTCNNFDPPAGYWCANETEGGGAFTYRIPSGLVADKSVLPNQPYRNLNGAIIQAWRPARWENWMFEVGSYNATSGTFMFSKGGFQGARGDDEGAEFFIENVIEELDYPNEWFFDTSTRALYFFYNASSGTHPPPDTMFVVPILKTLISVKASQSFPVSGITIRGIKFCDTAYTYMDPHGMPSGGDWAVQRSGALFFEGTENTLVQECIFERLDGNAVMISGYNRNVTIYKNEFVWIGDSAIVSWGYTSGSTIKGMGWDGTDGNQPRFNQILYNFAHELGIFQKQTAFYFQAKSCQNNIKGNIFFNGPRTGIDFNDGFGGGSNVSENLIFNTCRESGDHGPFNSWDRQVFITKVRTGSPDTRKEWDHIFNNFMIANYGSILAIDNDDGSAYYQTHGNFFVYSGTGMKNDYGGHDNHHYNNIYAYVGIGFGIVQQLNGHEDYFYNNTVVMTNDGDYGRGQTCSGDGMTIVYDNQIYTPTGNVTECNMSLTDWQAKGYDPGTTANKLPKDYELVSMIRKLLHI